MSKANDPLIADLSAVFFEAFVFRNSQLVLLKSISGLNQKLVAIMGCCKFTKIGDVLRRPRGSQTWPSCAVFKHCRFTERSMFWQVPLYTVMGEASVSRTWRADVVGGLKPEKSKRPYESGTHLLKKPSGGSEGHARFTCRNARHIFSTRAGRHRYALHVSAIHGSALRVAPVEMVPGFAATGCKSRSR